MKTYRERLQALIETLQACYDEVGVLRDYVDHGKMKDVLNQERGLLYDTWGPLRQLDNLLPDKVARMKTNGKGLCKE